MSDSQKPPVLTIKKKAHKDVVFHYNRTERYKLPGAPPKRIPRKKKGIFKRNPSLKILILDVLFILLLSAGIRFFFLREQPSGRVDGCEFRLHEILVKDKLFVSLDIHRDDSSEAGQSTLPVTFFLEPEGEIRNVTVELPSNMGDRLKFEASFVVDSPPQRVKVVSDDPQRSLELWTNVSGD